MNLTEAQKIEILQRAAKGQTVFEIKKEMNIDNGQQISGVLSSQHTKTGRYLLKKAGLQPTKPPPRPRSDLANSVLAQPSIPAAPMYFPNEAGMLTMRQDIERRELEIKHLKERYRLAEKLKKKA